MAGLGWLGCDGGVVDLCATERKVVRRIAARTRDEGPLEPVEEKLLVQLTNLC